MIVKRVAIAGFGNVGRAVASLLLARRARYSQLYATDVRLVAVCGSNCGVADDAGLEPDQFAAMVPGQSGPGFIAESGADILIEAGPTDFHTGQPGLGYIQSALGAGRDAIVISKGALVCDGAGLRALARRSGAILKISGATAAALPTIDLFDYNLAGCAVLRVEGILNATTNHLLDAMMTRGTGFAAALAQAQAGGFAERDPRNDTQGWDTAGKLLILANFGLGADLAMADVAVQGVEEITDGQIAGWATDGLTPKLIGTVWVDRGAFRAEVRVRALPASDPLAHVSGKNKAIRITTDVMGEIVAIGGGAEPAATAAAALKDLEHILRARL